MKVAVIDEAELADLRTTVAYLANELKELRATPRVNAFEPLTVEKVAKRYSVAELRVYDAVKSGRLRAYQRPGKGGAVWTIEAEDAHTWWRAFVRGTSNQTKASA